MSGAPDVADLVATVGLRPATLRRGDVEHRVGMSHEELVRWWRAMGFAEVPEGDVAFGEDDVAMASALATLLMSGRAENRDVLRLARVLGASFSRIAEAQVELFDQHDPLPTGDEAATASELDGTDTVVVDPWLLETFETSLIYVWRRHLLAALGRRLRIEPAADAVPAVSPDGLESTDGDPESSNTADHPADVTIGFVDISGFSKMSKRMGSDELADLIDRFEADVLDVVSSHGGRVVKFIGDAAMFAATDLVSGVEIGIELQERAATADIPVDLHCGVARGPGVMVGGDVFGPTVNLASRLTDIARRGTVVIPRDHMEDMEGVEDLLVRPVRRMYDLKGIGRSRVATVVRRPEEPPEVTADDGERAERERERAERRERRERERAERRERKEQEREERERERERERAEREQPEHEQPEQERERGDGEREDEPEPIGQADAVARLDPHPGDGPDSS